MDFNRTFDNHWLDAALTSIGTFDEFHRWVAMTLSRFPGEFGNNTEPRVSRGTNDYMINRSLNILSRLPSA